MKLAQHPSVEGCAVFDSLHGNWLIRRIGKRHAKTGVQQAQPVRLEPVQCQRLVGVVGVQTLPFTYIWH